jgi:gluconolactonase
MYVKLCYFKQRMLLPAIQTCAVMLMLVSGAGLAYCQSDLPQIKVMKPGANLQKISDQFTFTEGPAADKAGNIYFTDQPNNKIWKYDTAGKLSVFMDPAGRANGMYFDEQGNLIACADEKDELWSIAPGKKVKVLLKDFNGIRFNGPNDLWIDKKGSIYFTDPYYQRDYWTRTKPEMKGQYVYYLAKGKKKAVIADSTLVKPNGITGEPGGRRVYVADIGDNKTYRYDINPDGSLSNRTLFAPMGSDGMTIDNEGNIYLTGKGVTVFDKEGNRLGTIPVPSNWVGNVCFGGKHHDELFITASESVYVLKMQVHGVR